MLDRRHSDAALLVLAIAALALILMATLTLHHLVIGDEDRSGSATGIVLVDRSSGSHPGPAASGTSAR